MVLGSVHVDYCDVCHGIFLDRGELEEALTVVRARDKTATTQQVVAVAVPGHSPVAKTGDGRG